MVIAAGIGLLFQVGCGKTIEQSLESAAQEVNKTCPRNVDAETRLDKTEAGPGKTFTYQYTLINRTKSELDIEKLNAALRHGIVKGYKTDPAMKVFRDNGVTMHYRYNDKEGVALTEVVVAPNDAQ